jgi:hypothetical protein
MSIFLSYNSKDWEIVQQIAETLEKTYGKESVFYDRWSIQPGDSIIDRMNQGLESCKYFFFFISKNSLESEMVKLEWQSALIKKAKEAIKFIPVRIDKSIIPQVIAQTLYIDLFTQGLDVSIRQIIDVINNQNTYRNNNSQFHNIIGYISKGNKKVIIEFRAEYYMEPHSRYLILVDNEQGDLKWKLLYKGSFFGGFNQNIILTNGKSYNAVLMEDSDATSPGFPFTVELEQLKDKPIKIMGLMHASSRTNFKSIPMKEEGVL